MQPCEVNAMISNASNAADKSSIVKADTCPSSAPSRRRFMTSGSDVSVLWCAVRDIWEWRFCTVMHMVESYHNNCWSQIVAKLMQHNLFGQFGEKLQVWRRIFFLFIFYFFYFLMFASKPDLVSFRRGSRLPPWTADEQTLYLIFLFVSAVTDKAVGCTRQGQVSKITCVARIASSCSDTNIVWSRHTDSKTKEAAEIY